MVRGKEGKRERRLGSEGKGLISLPPSTFSLSRSSSLFAFVAPVTQAHIVLQLRVRLVPLKYHFHDKTRQDKKIYFTLLDFTYDPD